MRIILAALFLLVLPAAAQKPDLQVFLDCSNGGNCFHDFMRQELRPIQFVRDRLDADVHILYTEQWNSNGSRRTTLYLIGRKSFEHMQDTLAFSVDPNATENEQRQQLLRELQIGLFPFVAHTDLRNQLTCGIQQKDSTQLIPAAIKDPWNYWVFQVGINGNSNGNQNYRYSNANGYLTANRETANSRSNLYVNVSAEQQRYDDGQDIYQYRFQTYNLGAEYLTKRTEHWGIGLGGAFYNSLFSNYLYRFYAAPKVEYSIFPYAEFNTKRWVFSYEVGPMSNHYYDTTILFRKKEFLFQQNLSSIGSWTQPWGSINLGMFWSNYMNDFRKNRLEISGGISTRLAKGLNFAVWGNYAFQHDQINIRKGDATLDQLLVKNRELLSDFNYFIGVGLSYRFGSKNNSLVCPVFKGLSYSINL